MQREARPGSPVLSIYSGHRSVAAINVNRAFEVVLKNMLRDAKNQQSLYKHQRSEFESDAERVRKLRREFTGNHNGVSYFLR